MGVQGLVALLRKHAPEAFEQCTEEHLRGRRVGVDLSITIYRGAAVSYKSGPLSHLEGLLRELRWLLRMGCRPVYVLDGSPPEEKREELEKREAAKREHERRLQEFVEAHASALREEATQEQLLALQRRCLHVSPEMKEDARKLLAGLGVELVQAASEAEHCLAELMKKGLVDRAFTEDIDVLVCGSPGYVKNSSLLMYDSERALEGLGGLFTERKVAECVSLEPALRGLGLSREGFALLAVFSGCDFAPKLPRFGPATALKHVKKHGEDLEACFRDVKEEHQQLLERYRRSVQLFLQEDGYEALERAEPSREQLAGLLDKLRSQGHSVVLLEHLLREVLELQEEAERPSKRRRAPQEEGFFAGDALGQEELSAPPAASSSSAP